MTPTAIRLLAMNSRPDRLRVAMASRDAPIELSWVAWDELLDRLGAGADLAQTVAAFREADATAPVELELEDKTLLRLVIDHWSEELDDHRELPAGIWDLRCALIDDLHEAGAGP